MRNGPSKSTATASLRQLISFTHVALIVFAVVIATMLPSPVGAAAKDKFLPVFQRHIIDFNEMQKRRIVRVLVPYSKTIFFIDKGREFGTAAEFGKAFEQFINAGRKREIERIHVAFVPTPRDRLIPALNEGLGDIVMANLTVTPERQALVDFTDPIYDHATEVLVTGPASPQITALDDLSSKEIFARPSSSYWTHLQDLDKQFEAAGKAPFQLRAIDENLEDEDLMEMVNAGLLPWVVVDRYKAEIWASVFRDIKVRSDLVVASEGKIAWAIRKNSPELMAVLNAFDATHKIGTTFGNMLKNRYFKSDKIVKSAYSDHDVESFKRLVGIFRQYAGTYSFDYLLLLAQGYQESQLDQQRRSARGAVGIMQLLPKTASDKAVNIVGIDKDESRNVEAGAKYLRHLVDTYITDPDISDRDRQLMAFAAYNAGPGNLAKFRSKAKAMGLSPNVWFGNVENGAAEIVGRETVQYVSNIFKYYVAYSLLADRLQAHSGAVTPATPQQ